MHSISHCVSCGQTRPVTAGRALSLSRQCAASDRLPWDSSSIKRGMLTLTGQPVMHLGSLHRRQRSASSSATFSGKPRLTSLKLALLAFEAEIDLTYVGGIERGRRNP